MNDREYTIALARFVEACRKARGLTQGQMSEAGGLHIDTLSRIAHGRHVARTMSLSLLRRLAKALGTTPGCLLIDFERFVEGGAMPSNFMQPEEPEPPETEPAPPPPYRPMHR